MEEIKLLIVDDRDIIRDSIKLNLLKSKNILIKGEASDGQEAINMVKENHYDVILMDINMPNMDGVEATKEIKKIDPTTEILANSFFVNSERVYDMVEAGALGFIKKDEEPRIYQEAIRFVANGTIYLSDEINSNVYKQVLGYLKCSS
jgi:DNA-binding NarL/FixJ family response regulator